PSGRDLPRPAADLLRRGAVRRARGDVRDRAARARRPDPPGAGDQVQPGGLQALLEASGLDRPLHEQFFSYVAGALTGDLGVSFRSGQPVTVLLLDRLP